VLGEIGIVTIGILIAFALDAWWDDREIAAREQVHLHALAGDFEQNVAALRKLIELEDDISSSSLKLLDRSRAPEPGPKETVDDLLGRVFNSSRYEPVMGAYEALVNSGGLTLIRDDALRASLAQFAAQASGQYAESWSNELYFVFAREFAGRYMLHFQDARTPDERERAYEELLRDPRFQEHLVVRHYSERDVARKYRELLRLAETVLTQVRAQLRD
jgi:hypothetical protein